MEEHFEIRADVICHYYSGHEIPEIRNGLVKFLSYTEANTPTETLYTGFIERQSEAIRELFLNRLPDRDLWKNEGQITSACCREMVRQMNELLDITNDESFNCILYHFGQSEIVVPRHGIVLNKRIAPSHIDNPIIFGLLFSFILSRTAMPVDFLNSHLEETFARDVAKFESFLTLMLDDNSELLRGRMRTIDLWIKNNRNSLGANADVDVTPTVVAYMIKFIISGYPGTQVTSLFSKFQAQLQPDKPSWQNAIKTTYYRIEKENEVFHAAHIPQISLAIQLISSTEYPKAISSGKNLVSKL